MKIPETVEYRGVPFEFGDSTIIIPPLTTRLLEQNEDHLDALDEHMFQTNSRIEKNMQARKNGTAEETPRGELKKLAALIKNHLVPTVQSAVRKNYTANQISDEEISELVNAENWVSVFTALLGNSPKKKIKNLGELQPASENGTLTATSTGPGFAGV